MNTFDSITKEHLDELDEQKEIINNYVYKNGDRKKTGLSSELEFSEIVRTHKSSSEIINYVLQMNKDLEKNNQNLKEENEYLKKIYEEKNSVQNISIINADNCDLTINHFDVKVEACNHLSNYLTNNNLLNTEDENTKRLLENYDNEFMSKKRKFNN
jgi:hypothetical protein